MEKKGYKRPDLIAIQEAKINEERHNKKKLPWREITDGPSGYEVFRYPVTDNQINNELRYDTLLLIRKDSLLTSPKINLTIFDTLDQKKQSAYSSSFMPRETWDEKGKMTCWDCPGVAVFINIHPITPTKKNSKEREEWDENFPKFLQRLKGQGKAFIIMGDCNVTLTVEDCGLGEMWRGPKYAETLKRFQNLMRTYDLRDIHRDLHPRAGTLVTSAQIREKGDFAARVDLFLVPKALKGSVVESKIFDEEEFIYVKKTEQKKGKDGKDITIKHYKCTESDHVPVLLRIMLPKPKVPLLS
jgi:exonuclease III